MNVLVTGATGFIGQAVVAELVKGGHHVKAMHRRQEQKYIFMARNNLETVMADVNDPASMVVAVQDVDVVIHLAGVVWGDAIQMRSCMIDGTINLIEAIRQSKVKRLVLASSIAVYDWGKLNGILSEKSPLLDKSDTRQGPYALAKIQQESLALDLCRSYGIDLIVLRLGAVFTSGRLETADLGPNLTAIQVVIAPLRKLRLVALNEVAHSFIVACTVRVFNSLTINIVDEIQPTAWSFARKTRPVNILIPLPYMMIKFIAFPIYWLARIFGLESKLPKLFSPQRIKNRFKSCRYDSTVRQKFLSSIDRV